MPESRRYRIFIHCAAVFVSLIILAPFAWLAIASLASQPDLLKLPLKWIPDHISFDRYNQIFTSQSGRIFANFRDALVNSAIIATATATVAISITVGVPLDLHGRTDPARDPALPDHGQAAPAQHAARPDRGLLHVHDAVRAVDHGQLLQDDPARARVCGAVGAGDDPRRRARVRVPAVLRLLLCAFAARGSRSAVAGSGSAVRGDDVLRHRLGRRRLPAVEPGGGARAAAVRRCLPAQRGR